MKLSFSVSCTRWYCSKDFLWIKKQKKWLSFMLLNVVSWDGYIYSLLFNTSHGILIREKWDFPPNPFIPAWSLSKSLLCLLLHPGLKPFLFTWKQWWCHCYINRGLLCFVFQPGLWVNGMACLVIQTCFWKKSGMSPNTTWLVLKRKE